MLLRAILSILLLLQASGVMADGMSFQLIGASADVHATDQRAVLWLRDGNWELHIQPVFERQAGAAAWVVPFPVRPEVHQGDADFFDELEIMTAPVFLKICETSSGGYSFCMGTGGGLGTDEVQHGDALVHLWEHGKVGDLDYSIVSTADGGNLAAWLQDEGYQVPNGLTALLADYDTEGEFFFAARLSPDADPAKPLAPVRFVLPGMDDPIYPLRLTALGVAAGQKLDLTLWLIFPYQPSPTSVTYVPDNKSVVQFEDNPEDAAAYESALDELFDSNPDSLVALFGQGLIDRGPPGYVCGRGPCVSFAELGLTVPAAWSQPMQTILDNPIWVSRYQARLSAAAMTSDLTFKKGSRSDLNYNDAIYVKYTCDEELAGIGWLLVLAAGLGLLRRMVCNRKKRALSA